MKFLGKSTPEGDEKENSSDEKGKWHIFAGILGKRASASDLVGDYEYI